jgi:ribosomal protein L20
MNRKMLSEMAIHEPEAFTLLCSKAQQSVAAPMAKAAVAP